MISLCELEMSGMSTLHIRLRIIPPALSAVEFVGFFIIPVATVPS